MSGGHFLTASQRSSNFALQWTAGTYLLMALSQVISRELNVLSGKRLKLFATTRLDQPPRLDQPQSQRQRLRNLDHNFPMAYRPAISIRLIILGNLGKLLLTTRLDQPPRLDQPQSQRQRLRNLDHHNTLLDQPQDQRKGATGVNPSSRTTRNGPSRTSRREIRCDQDHRGRRSPSVSN